MPGLQVDSYRAKALSALVDIPGSGLNDLAHRNNTLTETIGRANEGSLGSDGGDGEADTSSVFGDIGDIGDGLEDGCNVVLNIGEETTAHLLTLTSAIEEGGSGMCKVHSREKVIGLLDRLEDG